MEDESPSPPRDGARVRPQFASNALVQYAFGGPEDHLGAQAESGGREGVADEGLEVPALPGVQGNGRRPAHTPSGWPEGN